MRVKYEAYRDGEWLVAAAIVKFNKRECKQLAKLIEREGEITLCFCTTIDRVENPLVIEQAKHVDEIDEDVGENRELSILLGMVEDEVADLRCWLEHGEPLLWWTTKQKGVNVDERLHCELALAC